MQLAKRRRLATPAFDAQDECEDYGPADDVLYRAPPPALLPDDFELSRMLQQQGAVLADAERWSAALAKFDEAASRDPSSSAAHEMRSQVLLQLGRNFDAVQAALQACSAAPDWGEARLSLARAQLNLGEPALALASAEAAILLGCDNQDEAIAEIEDIEGALLQAARATNGSMSAVDIALLQRGGTTQHGAT